MRLFTFVGRPLGCSEMSVRNYEHHLSNNREEHCSSLPHHGKLLN